MKIKKFLFSRLRKSSASKAELLPMNTKALFFAVGYENFCETKIRAVLTAAALSIAFSFTAQGAVFAAGSSSDKGGVCEISKEATVYIVGDSTACEYGYDENYAVPRAGWGMYFSKYTPYGSKVVNLALGGRSSKSFTSEENYQVLKNSLKKNDYLLIQFGHNDEKNSTPEDIENRYTDPEGDINTEGSFKNSLYENYIKLAWEKEAEPVLLSPVSRRKFDEKGKVTDSHGLYDDAVLELAKETGVKFIDMTVKTERLYNTYGSEITKIFHAAYKDKTKGIDNTHYNVYGANAAAALIASEMFGDINYEETIMTRGEFLSGLIRAAGKDGETDKESFSDVSESYEYADSIAAAKQAEITNGDNNGKFRPDEPVKFYDAVVFFMRALKHNGIECFETEINDIEKDILSSVPEYAFSDCANFIKLMKQNSENIFGASKIAESLEDEPADGKYSDAADMERAVYYVWQSIERNSKEGLPEEAGTAFFIMLYEAISNNEKTEVYEQDINELEKVEDTTKLQNAEG